MTKSWLNNRALQIAVIMLLAITVTACKRGRERPDQQIQTETIDPAAAKPEDVTPAEMTQTVDIEDSRSEADGGAITSPNPPVRTGVRPPTTTTTTTTTTTQTTPPPKRRP